MTQARRVHASAHGALAAPTARICRPGRKVYGCFEPQLYYPRRLHATPLLPAPEGPVPYVPTVAQPQGVPPNSRHSAPIPTATTTALGACRLGRVVLQPLERVAEVAASTFKGTASGHERARVRRACHVAKGEQRSARPRLKVVPARVGSPRRRKRLALVRARPRRPTVRELAHPKLAHRCCMHSHEQCVWLSVPPPGEQRVLEARVPPAAGKRVRDGVEARRGLPLAMPAPQQALAVAQPTLAKRLAALGARDAAPHQMPTPAPPRAPSLGALARKHLDACW